MLLQRRVRGQCCCNIFEGPLRDNDENYGENYFARTTFCHIKYVDSTIIFVKYVFTTYYTIT